MITKYIVLQQCCSSKRQRSCNRVALLLVRLRVLLLLLVRGDNQRLVIKTKSTLLVAGVAVLLSIVGAVATHTRDMLLCACV